MGMRWRRQKCMLGTAGCGGDGENLVKMGRERDKLQLQDSIRGINLHIWSHDSSYQRQKNPFFGALTGKLCPNLVKTGPKFRSQSCPQTEPDGHGHW